MHTDIIHHMRQRPCAGVKYVSYYGSTGYFVAAKRYMLGLRRTGLSLTWTPMIPDSQQGHALIPFPGNQTGDRELDDLCNAAIDYDAVILHIAPGLFPRWLEQERGKRILAYTVWDTDRLPHDWPALLNQTDRVLVPSQWNHKVFQQSGVTVPITVVPHIAGTNNRPAGHGFGDLIPTDYVFYTIETWTARKAVWDTIRCYLDAFTAADPTVLIVKTNTTYYGRPMAPVLRLPRSLARLVERVGRFFPGAYQKIDVETFMHRVRREYAAPARIEVITDELAEEEIHRLHSRGDCYVSLCRAEAWGLGAFEATNYGKPVIITGYGGQREFLPQELAYLVPYTIVPACDETDRAGITADQHWAQPSLPDATRLMRHVFENRDEAEARGRKLRTFVKDRFDGKKTIRQLLSVIRGESHP